jgi:hypothetical protein
MNTPTNTGLNDYKKIIYSQWGEDGIIENIFNRIGTKNKFCVEFGTGNGTECSNVWNLVKNHDWSALLMEPDRARYQVWLGITKDMKNLKILQTAITPHGETALENILSSNRVPINLDMLSIDIDGDDYHILKSLDKYKPRVIIIEHNPTIPPFDDIVQTYGEKESFGSSAKANVNLAHEKGYLLVAATRTNCLFVTKNEFEKLNISEPYLEELFDYEGLSYIVSGYNDTTYVRTPNANSQPSFGWFYGAHNLCIKKAFHAITFGLSLNRSYSKTLKVKYHPIKAFLDKTDKML